MKKTILDETFNGTYYEVGEWYEYLQIHESVEKVCGTFLHYIDYSCSWGYDSEDGDNGCVVAASNSESPIILGIDDGDVRRIIVGECKFLHHYHGEFPVFFQ